MGSTFEQAGLGWLPAIPIQINAGLDGGYDDNVTLSPSGQGSVFTRENVVLTYTRPGGQTQFFVVGVGRFSQYFDVSGQDETSGNVTMSLTHNFSSRLSFYASVYGTYQNEPNLTSNVGPQNVRSQKAIEKIGGVRVGSRLDGSGRDSRVYRITASR